MPFSRRDVLVAVVAVPAGFIAGSVAGSLGRLARQAAVAVRPNPVGTSSTVCATCGAAGHTMLDPRCPAARRIF